MTKTSSKGILYTVGSTGRINGSHHSKRLHSQIMQCKNTPGSGSTIQASGQRLNPSGTTQYFSFLHEQCGSQIRTSDISPRTRLKLAALSKPRYFHVRTSQTDRQGPNEVSQQAGYVPGATGRVTWLSPCRLLLSIIAELLNTPLNPSVCLSGFCPTVVIILFVANSCCG